MKPVPAILDFELSGENEVWRGSLERANKRIRALTEEVRRLEVTGQGTSKEISTLQAMVSRLKDQNTQLEQRVSDAIRENEGLRIGESQKSRQINALVRSVNQLQNNHFWSIYHFIAGSTDFEVYANKVNFDLPRLFCMLLVAEIDQTSDVSPEIKQHASTIGNIFDPFFYLTEYQDVALTGTNPLFHYVTQGYRQKHKPSALFDSVYYVEKAALPHGDPLLHYVLKGARMGLRPHPLFDGRFYLEQYPDVAQHDVNPLFHYQTWGGREGRNPSLVFDTQYFLASRNLPTIVDNPLREYLTGAGGQAGDPHPLFHSAFFCEQAQIENPPEAPLALYEKNGELQKRVRPHPLFDMDFMRDRFDVAFDDGASPLEVFCRLTRERDIDPSILFDSKLYRYQIEVEKGATLTEPPIFDYLKRGYKDKTILPNLAFDPEAYLERNRIEVSGPELTHYCLVGDREGFYTHPLFCAKVYNAERTDGTSATALEHFLSSEPDQTHKSHTHVGRPLSQEVLKFIRRIYTEGEEFSPSFYRELYQDLTRLTPEDATRHYEKHGAPEGRMGSARALIRHHNLLIRDIPLGFFPDEYVNLNPDLTASGMRTDFLPLLSHYIRCGRAEKRPIGLWQFYLDSLDLRIPTSRMPLSLDVDASRIDIGVIVHLFYTDLWPEIAAFARNFEGVSRDIFVNVVDIAWGPRFQRELRELCPGAFVQLSNDNGRDIGGFVRLLDNVDIKKYEYFAWMHSKKSPHIAMEKGEYWRRSLLGSFAGNPETVASCIQQFRDDPSIGLIGAKEWRTTEMGRNEEQFNKMLELFEIDEQHRDVEYLSGTMFLIRSEIVQRLYERLKTLDWEYGGDKDLSFHVDGQIAHAVERVIGNIVRQMGYRMVWR